MRNSIKKGVVKFYAMHLTMAVMLAVIYLLVDGQRAAISAILGGLICIVPGLMFAMIFFRFNGVKQAKKIMGAFYFGEMLKIIVAGILFAVTFANYEVNAKAFFISFIMAQAFYWLAPCLLNNKGRKSS